MSFGDNDKEKLILTFEYFRQEISKYLKVYENHSRREKNLKDLDDETLDKLISLTIALKENIRFLNDLFDKLQEFEHFFKFMEFLKEEDSKIEKQILRLESTWERLMNDKNIKAPDRKRGIDALYPKIELGFRKRRIIENIIKNCDVQI